jgi:hypothetical protein
MLSTKNKIEIPESMTMLVALPFANEARTAFLTHMNEGTCKSSKNISATLSRFFGSFHGASEQRTGWSFGFTLKTEA